MEITKKCYLVPCSVLVAITQQSELRLGPGGRSNQQISLYVSHGGNVMPRLTPGLGSSVEFLHSPAGDRGDHDCPHDPLLGVNLLLLTSASPLNGSEGNGALTLDPCLRRGGDPLEHPLHVGLLPLSAIVMAMVSSDPLAWTDSHIRPAISTSHSWDWTAVTPFLGLTSRSWMDSFWSLRAQVTRTLVLRRSSSTAMTKENCWGLDGLGIGRCRF